MRFHAAALVKGREWTTVDPGLRAYFHLDHAAGRVIFSDATRAFCLDPARVVADPDLASRLRRAKVVEVGDADLRRLERRVHHSLPSFLQDPPAALTLREALLFVLAKTELSLEYLGRARKLDEPIEPAPTEDPARVFVLDVAGGRRQYLWKTHPAAHVPAENPRERLAPLARWLRTPDTRVVLSLGSGGLRMFAITAVLKILDLLDVREDLDEVWGSSGGAVIGLPYAEGVAPHWLEQIGYDYYNERHPDLVLKRSGVRTALSALVQQFGRIRHPMAGLVDVQKVLVSAVREAIDRRNPQLGRVPFFAVASNSTRGRVAVLTSPDNLRPHLADLLTPCDPVRAVAASAAIPFLFPAETIPTGIGFADAFVDGMLGEETPTFLPLVKWMRDRRADPEGTPPKLRLLRVEIASRRSEHAVPRWSQVARQLYEAVAYAGRLLDLTFDGRRQLIDEIIATLPEVELLSLRLRLDRPATLSVREIPHIIQSGRDCFFEQLVDLSERLEQSEPSREEPLSCPSRS